MNLIIFFIVGCIGSWYLTWGITSCITIHEDGKPDWCEANVAGPFRIFDFVRWLFTRSFIPPFVRENAGCPYCVSFWTSFFIALLLPIYRDLSWIEALKVFYIFWLGMSGVIAFYFRRIRILYGLEAKDF